VRQPSDAAALDDASGGSIGCREPQLPGMMRLSSRFCFLAARFSFSDFPSFLVLGFWGVFAGMVAPSGLLKEHRRAD
jgi:hypothetical protein